MCEALNSDPTHMKKMILFGEAETNTINGHIRVIALKHEF
jgi:hypothetical protein